MTSIREYKIASGAIDASGDAVAYSSTIRGRILKVGVNYDTNTCTVDLDSQGETNDQKIMDLAAANTDATYYPRVAQHDNTGAALDLSDAEGGNVAKYGYFTVYGRIKLTIAAGTEDEEVSVTITVEEN